MFLPNTGGQEGEEGRRREKKESSPSELNISRAVWVAAQWSYGHTFQYSSSSNATWWGRFNTDLKHLERDFKRLCCPHQKNNSICSSFKSNLSPHKKTDRERQFWKYEYYVHCQCFLMFSTNICKCFLSAKVCMQSKPGCAFNKPVSVLESYLTTAKGKSTCTFSGRPNSKVGHEKLNRTKADNSECFWTVSPRRHSWCFTHEEWRKEKNRAWERSSNPAYFHTPGQMLREVGMLVGFSISESFKNGQIQPLQSQHQ